MMDPSNPGGPPPEGVHEPFTRAERMEQLAQIDQDIVSLLALSGNALQNLGRQNHTIDENNQPPKTTDEQIQSFQETMDSFLTTLHRVDVRMKRQIFGLEEAGILTLDKTKPKDDDGIDSAQKPTLEPNGMGMVGNLDVGWLNSRSNQVELEKEAEVWTSARKALENVSRGSAAATTTAATIGATGSNGDVSMTGVDRNGDGDGDVNVDMDMGETPQS